MVTAQDEKGRDTEAEEREIHGRSKKMPRDMGKDMRGGKSESGGNLEEKMCREGKCVGWQLDPKIAQHKKCLIGTEKDPQTWQLI